VSLPIGRMNDQTKVTAAFERALKGRCFCPRGKAEQRR
jgi:hypothetical protein